MLRTKVRGFGEPFSPPEVIGVALCALATARMNKHVAATATARRELIEKRRAAVRDVAFFEADDSSFVTVKRNGPPV